MWRVVDRPGRCVHHRGRISTVHTPHFRYGMVTVGDSMCGDGSYVLRKKRGGHGRWRVRTVGSDIGAPGRCSDDARKVPKAVLRDLFGKIFC